MKLKYSSHISMLSSIGCLVALIATNAMAAAKSTTIEHCEKNSIKNTELVLCLDQLKSRADKELTTWVNNQIFILEALSKKTGRGAPLNIFNRSQKLFRKYREDNCRWQYLQISPGPGATTAYKKCYINLTKARSLELAKLSR